MHLISSLVAAAALPASTISSAADSPVYDIGSIDHPWQRNDVPPPTMRHRLMQLKAASVAHEVPVIEDGYEALASFLTDRLNGLAEREASMEQPYYFLTGLFDFKAYKDPAGKLLNFSEPKQFSSCANFTKAVRDQLSNQEFESQRLHLKEGLTALSSAAQSITNAIPVAQEDLPRADLSIRKATELVEHVRSWLAKDPPPVFKLLQWCPNTVYGKCDDKDKYIDELGLEFCYTQTPRNPNRADPHQVDQDCPLEREENMRLIDGQINALQHRRKYLEVMISESAKYYNRLLVPWYNDLSATLARVNSEEARITHGLRNECKTVTSSSSTQTTKATTSI
jgi:hypothetical protein